MKIEQEIEMFQGYTKVLAETFARKRIDYGPTTTETFEKFGPVSMLVRMHDKLGRLDNLISDGRVPNYESIEDTLIDLANYCLITLLEFEKHKLIKCEEATSFEGYIKR
jgi:hypothetical protein